MDDKLQKLRNFFNQQKEHFSKEWRESGVSTLLEKLSTGIVELRGMGVEVEMELSPLASADTVALISHLENGQKVTPISGTLRLNGNERSFAIVTRANGKDYLTLCIAQFVGKNPPKDYVDTFDFRKDPDTALIQFQGDILFWAARTSLIEEHDVANAFGKGETLRLNGKPRTTPRSGNSL